MNNPFDANFGKKPPQQVNRLEMSQQIIAQFEDDTPGNQVYMLTGVRGAGKTVMMTTVAKHFQDKEDWIVVELSPEMDAMQSLLAQLYARPQLCQLSIKAKLDFSAFGLGVSIEKAPPITDIGSAVGKMLEQVQKAKKRLLVCMDEVVVNPSVRLFASMFQIYLRQEYPIFLLMTGLYHNIDDLQNVDTLTFLYRAPKLFVGPLDLVSVAQKYKRLLEVDCNKANELAQLTKGYAYAFQLLGYLYFPQRQQPDMEEILEEFDEHLRSYVYVKLWSECSETDRRVLYAMATTEDHSVKHLRELLDMKQGSFSTYRDRLSKKGIIDTSSYGKVNFALPRFQEFVLAYGDA